MTLAACAALVEAGDPDRHLATMAAPEGDRALLWPLYAFNLEIARAPWASDEPMIAEMRLQFWRDALDAVATGAAPPAHEVAVPLSELVHAAALPLEPLREMIEARRWDIGRAPFADEAALLAHLQATSSNLMWLAAQALGAPAQAEPVVRDAGLAAGVAGWLVAVPTLEARGRVPLVDGRPEGVRALARQGLAHLSRARARRAQLPRRALPALLAGWRSGALLSMAARRPERVGQGALVQSEFRRRGSLLLRGLSGLW
ncbi:squalene/phytoene synthase family protein [Alkalilacustris brevis]|uniref:squalene/phytoene synthase family protein n=1 Tax=Alkalilacustris brevis TaxID=2026338 RepID=UPI000E0D9052|nr:squalene/phytoene synthase family protein [Alkalilacustris brevis]